MKIERHYGRWGDAYHFGPFIDYQDWNVNHHEFTIGLEIGPFILGLKFILWDFFEEAKKKAIPVLQSRGMTEDEAWDFIEGIRQGLIARKEGKVRLWPEIKKELKI